MPFRLDLSDSDIPQSFPLIASADDSPSSEALSYVDTADKAGLVDAYKGYSLDQTYSLDDYINSDVFDRPLNTVEIPSGFTQQKSQMFNTPSNMNQWTSYAPTPFGAPGAFTDAFRNGLPFGTDVFVDSACGSVPSSPNPSIFEDSGRPSLTVSSPTLTNNSLKRESPEPAEDEPAPKRVAKKRGRPRLHRPDSDAGCSNDEGSKSRQSRRLPHNQVERKYREGLNAELERLRRAVPTLPQRDSTDLTSPPKPSKATVLASAIDYIKSIEAERDRLREENESLRGLRPSTVVRSATAQKLDSYNWNKTRTDSVNPNPLAINS